MSDTLIHAFGPLVLWSSIGFLIFGLLPEDTPRLLGRGLYWIGVPLEIFALAHQTRFDAQAGWVPLVTIAALIGGWGLAWIGLKLVTRWVDRSLMSETTAATLAKPPSETSSEPIKVPAVPDFLAPEPRLTWQDRSRQGSFILSSIIGNTGFVGLAIAPGLVDEAYLSWVVLYSVTHNVLGTYGIGVLLSSYYGRSHPTSVGSSIGWTQIKDVITVPSLWAFGVGILSQSVHFPDPLETGLHASIWVVIPAALILMGMRLSQLRGWNSLRLAIAPTVCKIVLIPLLVGITATLAGLNPAACLALVIMSGMPSAFAGLILAEEYELDRELIASSILLSTVLLLVTLPTWLLIWGDVFNSAV